MWAVDRRSNAFEDTSRFQPGTSADEAYDYYLDKLAFKIVDGPRDAPFARGWGLKVAMEDLRRVILSAKRGGHKVILGGHSLGGSSTVAYATWDFKGKPGYKDVDGLVLIDGGLLGSFDSANLSQARRRKAKIDSGEPFSALLEGLPPWAAGVFAEVARAFLAKHGAQCRSPGPELPAAARRVQARVPRDQRGAARPRLRHRHLAQGPRAAAPSTPGAWPPPVTRAVASTAS